MSAASPYLRRRDSSTSGFAAMREDRPPLPRQRLDSADRDLPESETAREAAAARRRVDLAIILAGALIFTTLPSFADIQFGGRLPVAENSTGPVILTGIGDQLRILVTPLPYLVFIIVLVRNLGIGGRRIGSALLFAAFCAVISVASLMSIGDATFAFRDVAFFVASVWLIAPRADDLVVFARFGVAIAAVSLLLAAGGLNGWMAAGAGAGKGIFAERLLAGPFPQMNVLGMALATILPLTALLHSPFIRFAGFGTVAVALLLTSSRTSLLAAAVATLVYLVIRAVRGRIRVLVAWSAVAAAAVAIALLPWMTDDPDAFTKRGEIWLTSRQLLPGNWLFGLGISAYSVGGPVMRAGDMDATWHGHNILVTALVMGGALTALLFLLLFLVGIRKSIQHIDTRPALLASALTLFMIGLAETPVRFDTFDGAAWMTWTVFAALLFLAPPERAAEDRSPAASEGHAERHDEPGPLRASSQLSTRRAAALGIRSSSVGRRARTDAAHRAVGTAAGGPEPAAAPRAVAYESTDAEGRDAGATAGGSADAGSNGAGSAGSVSAVDVGRGPYYREAAVRQARRSRNGEGGADARHRPSAH